MKDEILCPECEGPCTISWSGLELVENTGDETLAKKHFHSKAPDLLAALVEARDTMEPFIEFAKERLANPQGLPVIFEYNGVQITSEMLLKITESYDKINQLLNEEK